jgi:hypothetical protein
MDPYYIDNYEASLDDDIKTIIGTHTVDEHGTDLREKNNIWSSMSNFIVIPLFPGVHWRSIRIQIDNSTSRVSTLYDDPYGEQGFNDDLITKIEPALKIGICKLMSHAEEREIILDSKFNTRYKKSIDQQGITRNGFDCGPIAFSNIANYANHQITHEQFVTVAGLYTISLVTDTAHEDQILNIRETDVAHYKEVSGVTMPGFGIERIKQIKQFSKDDLEKRKKKKKLIIP